MRRLHEQARRWVLRELDHRLQQRGRAALAVTCQTKLIEELEAAAAFRQQGSANLFIKAGMVSCSARKRISTWPCSSS